MTKITFFNKLNICITIIKLKWNAIKILEGFLDTSYNYPMSSHEQEKLLKDHYSSTGKIRLDINLIPRTLQTRQTQTG